MFERTSPEEAVLRRLEEGEITVRKAAELLDESVGSRLAAAEKRVEAFTKAQMVSEDVVERLAKTQAKLAAVEEERDAWQDSYEKSCLNYERKIAAIEDRLSSIEET